MACGEFSLIARYFDRVKSARLDVETGIGDDCALLNIPEKNAGNQHRHPGGGNHFLPDIDPADLAYKALAVNLSDLAAMGAEPAWLTLALTLPEADEAWLEAFSDSLFVQLNYYDMQLIGGDTTRGPLSMTLGIHGYVPTGRALKRSGAKHGDWIYVTGTPGDSAAGLAILQDRLQVEDDADADYLLARHLRPLPRVLQGQALRDLANAAIDLSDGLISDLGIFSRPAAAARASILMRCRSRMPCCARLSLSRRCAGRSPAVKITSCALPYLNSIAGRWTWPLPTSARVLPALGRSCRNRKVSSSRAKVSPSRSILRDTIILARSRDVAKSRLKMSNPWHLLATGFGSGLSPVVPGTMGSLASIPFWYLLTLLPWQLYSLAVMMSICIGVYICHRTAKDMGTHDHGSIVWDEFVGMWITLMALPTMDWQWVAAGFVIFRLFDMWKPWPIRWFDRNIHGGMGIMVDDIVAGVISAGVLYVIGHHWPIGLF